MSLCLTSVAWADGMLDPGFGAGGLVTTNFGMLSIDVAGALALQPDGRAIAAGSAQLNLAQSFMAAARYLPSGALDPSFDGDGTTTIAFGVAPELQGGTGQVLLQPDGRIILVGWFAQSLGGLHYALARLLSDGSLDPSFGTGGKVTTPLAGGVDAGRDGLLQPDGRIVVVGTAGSMAAPVLALARYNMDGSLDGTFGTAGQASVPLPVPFRGGALALQPDGKLLIAGFTGGTVGPADIGLVRLLPGGAPDPTFDGDGFVTSDFGALEFAAAVAVLGDGRILVAGHRSAPAADLALVRYLPTGALDTTFGTSGLATADSGSEEFSSELIVQPDGRLLVAGTAFGPPSQDFILARFQANGAHDTTFGTAGFLRTDFGLTGGELGLAAALAGPDRILVSGSTMTLGTSDDFALARYIASTPVEATSFSIE
jgi:uncharacterized delta-60 repeat protein